MKISIENSFIGSRSNSRPCCSCLWIHSLVIGAFSAALVFFMGSASAQIWQYVAKSDAGTEYYLDKNTMGPQGRMYSYSQLSNYVSGIEYNNKLIRSLVATRISDCVENKFRTIRAVGYSDHDGKGKQILISSNLESDWIMINMEKITGYIQSEVCK